VQTLNRETRKRLEELRACLALPDADPAVRARLATECRFGFHQSLQAWPDNADAVQGLTETLRVLIEHALDAGNLASANALLAELPVEDPALRERTAALARQLEAQAEIDRAARDQARQMDERVAQHERIVIAGGVLSFSAALAVYRRYHPAAQSGRTTHVELVVLWVVLMAIAFSTFWIGRKRLMAHRFNRQWATACAVMFVTVLVHRAIAVVLMPGLPSVLLSDMLTFACGLGVIAVFTTWRMLTLSGVIFLAACAVGAFPESASRTVNATVGVSALLYIALTRSAAGALEARERSAKPRA
jgi:hypothetical protein